jgi:mannose-1-phosphate guanylyltransferase
MLIVAGYPVTAHQLARAREAGVERVVLGTSYKSEVFADAFGQGEDFDLRIDYSYEAEPLGTGGGIAQAGELLECGPDDPVIVFNGDVLTGIDITKALTIWRESGADVGLYLVRVEDPRAYGLVPTDDRGFVTAFLEKPETESQIVTDQINAGMYIMRKRVIDALPRGRVVSVEREIFPELLEKQIPIIGIVDEGYWLDLGTPAALVQGSIDLVSGRAPSPLLDENPYLGLGRENLVFPDAQVAADAQVDGGSVVMPGATIGDRARVHGTVVGRGASIGAGAVVKRSYLADGVAIADGAILNEEVIATPD